MRRLAALALGLAGLVACPSTESRKDGEREAKPQPDAEPDSKFDASATPRVEPEPEPDAQEGPPVRKDGTIYASAELMGTRVSLNVWLPPGKTPEQAAAAMQAALDEMARIEDVMSEWRPTSELSRLSKAAGGEPQTISEDLAIVLARAKAIAADTDGAFDPTFHAVGQLWSFAPGATPPSKKDIAAKLVLIDHVALEVDLEAKTARLTKPGMMLGLGAIAKGYAVDRASAVLAEHGLPHHVVEAGGDTYAAGTKDGKPWGVGIQKPGERGVVGILPSTNRAVVTSGDYQRFFEYEGKRYAHILDPSTGWPVPADKSPQSVTLVAGNATDADAYATAVAVKGAVDGMAFVESRADLEAVVIDGAGKVHISSGLADEIVQPTAAP